MGATSPTLGNEKKRSSIFISGTAIVLYVAAIRIVLYLVAGRNYGYFRDELYYLACGEHPAWGYVDQPPLIGWLAWLLEHTIGTSLWALRALPALAGTATVILAGMLARELGGRRWAMFLAALAALMAPVLLALSHIFTMNAFDPLLWTAMAWLVVRIAKTGEQQLWAVFGALAGITILNKYGVLFWLIGVLAGVLLTPLRTSLRHQWFWLGCVATIALSLPNLLWQWRFQFPFLQLMHNVRANGRDVALPPLPFLKTQAEMLGYVSALLVIFAVAFAFSKAGRPFRALGWAYLIFLGVMMVLRGKMYYLAPVYPMMFAAGAVWLEQTATGKGWRWTKPALALGIAAVSAIYAPTIMPILSVPEFLKYEHAMHLEPPKFEHQKQGVLPQIYADMFGWEQITQRVAAYYHSLPPAEQKETAIFANNYGDAGAIDFFGPKYGLPKAIGNHQNYWIWGPRDYTGASMIVLGESDVHRMQTLCTSYSVIGTAEYPLSRPDEWRPIYHCRGLKESLQTLWPKIKHWD